MCSTSGGGGGAQEGVKKLWEEGEGTGLVALDLGGLGMSLPLPKHLLPPPAKKQDCSLQPCLLP